MCLEKSQWFFANLFEAAVYDISKIQYHCARYHHGRLHTRLLNHGASNHTGGFNAVVKVARRNLACFVFNN